jgi:alanine dehydrogenase
MKSQPSSSSSIGAPASRTDRAAPRGTLILTRREVAGLLALDDCIAAVEAAFHAHGLGRTIPPGVLSAEAEGGAFHVKTAGLLAAPRTARSYFAAKVNGNFYRNAERGLPRIQGVIALADAETGFPLAVMDSTEITLARTAAATAVAARHLARADARVATICGCGLQGRVQLRALCRVRPIERVFAFDADPAAAERLVSELAVELGIEIEPVEAPGRAAAASDLVVTCTPSRRPLLGLGDVWPGAFIAAVGADSPEKQELSPELLAAARVVVDSLEQCAAIGELHHALDAGALSRAEVHAELAQVVAGERPGRTSPEEIFVFDSTGVALEDVAAAALVFERAASAGVGTWSPMLA